MKKMVITKAQYKKVKNVIETMGYFADGRHKVAEELNIDYDTALKILKAVYYNYNYLEIKEVSNE